MGNSEKEKISIQGTLLMLDDETPHVAVPVQAILVHESQPVGETHVVATVLSDKRGRYRFADLEPGAYQLRCQVLGGYVYYRATNDALPVIHYESQVLRSAMAEYTGDTLKVEHGKSPINIDFRFAPFKKGTWETYTYLDGLASDFVKDIHSDPDGVIWFATASSGGVSRYDGKEFVNFTTEDGLVNNEVSVIHSDPDGVLWFGTGLSYREGGGVSRYDGREFVNFTTEDGLAHNRVLAIHRDPDGVLWFGTFGGGVSRYDGKEFVNYTTKDGLVSNNVITIHCDSNRVMWFGTFGGVSRYDGREFVNLTTKDGLADNYVIAIHGDPDGVMWFGTGTTGGKECNGVSRYDGKTFVNFTAHDGLAGNNVLAIHRDSNDGLWFAIHGCGVTRYDDKTFVSFTTEDGLMDSWIRSSHIDSDGVTWFGTHGGGISRYDGKEFVNFTTEDGLADSHVGAIYSDPNGVMWFATWHGVSRYDGREFVNFTTEDGLAGNYVYAINNDSTGVLWFGTHGGGVSRYDGNEFVNLTINDGLAYDRITAIHGDPDDVMWFGTRGGGVFRYDGEKFANLTTEDGLVGNDVNVIYRDPDDIMWFGTVSGVSRYDGKEFISLTTKDGLANNTVRSLHHSPDGVMWFGIQGGVSGYDGIAWTSLDTRDGLADNGVQSIHQDSDGFLWFGTKAGITRYRRDDLPPKAHIASVTTDQIHRDLSDIPEFIPGTRVTIEYGSIDLKTIPGKRQYRCRIKEIDSEWRKPTTETSSDFIFDEPGTYTFEVQAIDRDLNYSEPASVKLEVITDPRNHRIIQLEAHIREQELAEMERVHQELEDARQIQQSLLPESPPEVQGFDIAGTSIPAKEVSGDFYSYLSLGNNLGIVLADVTGKSVRAAMVGALADGTLHAEVEERESVWDLPAKILSRLNIRLQPRLIRGIFTAMSLGILQPEAKRLLFSNAGMPYPIVKRDREVQELEVSGMPLGLMDRAEYQDLSLDLEEGDFVIFYSDGVIEAENEAEEMYQTERLLEIVQQADPSLSAQGMVDLIVDNVTAFVGGEQASDDITIVVLRSIV